MNGSRGNLISCSNCGSPNVMGVRWCRNCHAILYYNCPYCYAWVDNTISNCSNCGNKLNWPKEVYYIENTYNPDKSTSPAVPLLLLSCVLLFLFAFNFMANNSYSANAVSQPPGVAASDNLPTNELKVVNQPQIQDSYPISSNPSNTQITSSSSYPASVLSSAQEPISYDTTIIIPVIPSSSTTTGTYVPKSSSYLNTVFPTWGHCSGGSCRGYYQQ